MHKIVNFFTSLRLTVACLTAALVLVFIGTIAQVKLGLYVVQEKYFSSFFVWWEPAGGSLKIPVWPGGYLIGMVLLLNLIAAHIKRFEFSRKKAGIFIIHAGLILLLVGQLLSQVWQVESYMAIEEGATKNFSESGRSSEIAIIDVTDKETDSVVAIPQSLLKSGKEITHAALPFKVKVQSYFVNSDPVPSGSALAFEEKPFETSMNKRNIPSATVEIITDEGSKGVFPVSNFKTEANLIDWMGRVFGNRFSSSWVGPATFSHKDRQYEIVMRPERYYKPFTVQLMDFTHDRYAGTEIPKNFSSRVKLLWPAKGEDREVLIYMNNPLRYWGETYYQGGFERGDTVSILQVVRNPSWITPYVACVLVTLGLVVQFLSHLIGFARKRTA
jgi:hypothetical protein